MKIQNETFYVVQTPANDHILSTEAEAIDHLRSNGANLDPETDELSVAEVSFSGEDWTIKELPWQRIALQLLGED